MRTFVVLFIFLSVARTVYGDCSRPTGGANMVITGEVTFPVADGTTVTFECETGYQKVGGTGTIACSGGLWSNLNMRCEKRNCGSAGEVTNGYVDYSEGTEFGAFARVVCNDGYVVVGIENQIYCGEKGWQGRLAECQVVSCEPPNAIANGYFSPNKDTYEHSEVITYSCVGDYKLNGSRTASCHEDGQFKPAPPECVSVSCSEPTITHGVLAGGSRPPYKHLSSVIFRCNTGYNMEGGDTVSCDINSNWSPALPICTPVKCKAPEIENGEVVGGSRPTYDFSNTVTMKCQKGYKLSGQSTLTCGERNQWSPALPTCILIQCQTPEVEGGVLVGGPRPSYKYLDTVRFECKSGHILSGESTLTCDANSQWSPKLPKCTQVVCRAPEVKHGQVVEGSRPSYKYMDSVVFECTSGYKMSGESTVMCAENSQWSPELPECKSDILIIVLIILAIIFVIIFIGICIYCAFLKKKKRAEAQYTGAPREAETVALS